MSITSRATSDRETVKGRIIEVALSLRSGEYKSLTWMKTFGKADECWEIARAIDEAGSTPSSSGTKLGNGRDVHEKVPAHMVPVLNRQRRSRFCRERTRFWFPHEPASFLMTLLGWPGYQQGIECQGCRSGLDHCSDEHEGAVQGREGHRGSSFCPGSARLRDLQTRCRCRRVLCPPHQRAMKTTTGCILGYFPDADAAIRASRDHKDRQTPVA